MPLKSASSTIALSAAAAFALSTSAFAQTMVGGQEVSDEDLPMVTAHCEILAGEPATDAMDGAATDGAATDGTTTDGGMTTGEGTDADSATGDTATDTMADTDAGGEPDAGSMDIETDADTATDGAAESPTGDVAAVDIDAITIEDCQAAGLSSM